MKEKYKKPKIESEDFSIEMMTAGCSQPETEIEFLAGNPMVFPYPFCNPPDPCLFDEANQIS